MLWNNELDMREIGHGVRVDTEAQACSGVSGSPRARVGWVCVLVVVIRVYRQDDDAQWRRFDKQGNSRDKVGYPVWEYSRAAGVYRARRGGTAAVVEAEKDSFIDKLWAGTRRS